ncbi:Fms-interacting protein-domain-containing protein [Fimicolochytrium jonesii]|uniref:Fms-interacting protein-domain-containing protein n=1 Tax=Fimicolochytrium jonesii TaxID=1396493 RepID=UPI0022FE0BC0|nr:Fms-interacting protein-domain-containing protein [Fimicolochytrium jonesii]KAI8826870.1 Fms-interacting protein-domain-containing protein [Fimicolochytrium jonesii]
MSIEKRKRSEQQETPTLPHVAAIGPICESIREEARADKKRRLEDESKATEPNATVTIQAGLSNVAAVRFMELLETQRKALSHTAQRKQATQEAKHSMDKLNLELQNLLYEIRHFEQSIADCKKLETNYQNIELVSEAEISLDAATDTDSHDIMLKRLNYELEERIRLVEEEKALEVELARAQIGLSKETAELEALDKELMEALKATLPLQKRLNIETTAKRATASQANLLPEPLYVLYKHALGYMATAENELSVEIKGDIDLAATMRMESKTSSETKEKEINEAAVPAVDRSASADDMDIDIDQHARDQTKDKGHADRSATYYSKHPLEIVMTIYSPPASTPIPIAILKFSYLTNLQIVVVAAEPAKPWPHIPSHMLTSCLWPEDTGLVSPNPANAFLGGDAQPFHFSPSLAGGYAYIWTQALCGFSYPGALGTFRYYFTRLPEMVRYRVGVLEALSGQVGGIVEGEKGQGVRWRVGDAKNATFELLSAAGDDEPLAEVTLSTPPPSTAAAGATPPEVKLVVREREGAVDRV